MHHFEKHVRKTDDIFCCIHVFRVSRIAIGFFVRTTRIKRTKKRKSRETRFPCLGTGMKCPVRFKGSEPCPVSDVSSLSTGYYLPKPLLDWAGFSKAETPAGEFGGRKMGQKLTRHNGRSGAHGTYNPKHNDRSFNIYESDHIDALDSEMNVYWDAYSSEARIGLVYKADGENDNRFVEVEKRYYAEHYQAFCDGQHARNKKNGHPERDRTTEDLRTNRKTCPEETLIQIGAKDNTVDSSVLYRVAAEYFQEFDMRFGSNVHILNWALHLDESTPHIHERHVFDAKNAHGEIAPQQGKALEELGIPLPKPDEPESKTNNRKIMFDSICRQMLFDIARTHGLELDQEPEYGGRSYLEKQDYIIMKQKQQIKDQKAEIKDLDEEIQDKHQVLDSIKKDLEAVDEFKEEMVDCAVNNIIQHTPLRIEEETRQIYLNNIIQFRDYLTGPKSPLNANDKTFVKETLNLLLQTFQGWRDDIDRKLKEMFGELRNSFRLFFDYDAFNKEAGERLSATRAMLNEHEAERQHITRNRSRSNDLER